MLHEFAEGYRAALEGGDPAAALAFFADDAVVVSPLYGEASAAEFVPAYMADTRDHRLQLIEVFVSADTPGSAALRLRSRWTLVSGFTAEVDVVHLLELEAGRIRRVAFLYDTAAVRETFAAMKGLWGPGSALEQTQQAKALTRMFEE